MRPYRYSFPQLGKNLLFSFVLLSALGVTPAGAGSPANKGDFEALTHSGLEHFYSLEYDQAIRDFQKALEVASGRAESDQPSAGSPAVPAALQIQRSRHPPLH